MRAPTYAFGGDTNIQSITIRPQKKQWKCRHSGQCGRPWWWERMSCFQWMEILNKIQQQNFITELSSKPNRDQKKKKAPGTNHVSTAQVSITAQRLAVSNRSGTSGLGLGSIPAVELRLWGRERLGTERSHGHKTGPARRDLAPEFELELYLWTQEACFRPRPSHRWEKNYPWVVGMTEYIIMSPLSHESRTAPTFIIGVQVHNYFLVPEPFIWLLTRTELLRTTDHCIWWAACFFTQRNSCRKTQNHNAAGSFHHHPQLTLPAWGQGHHTFQKPWKGQALETEQLDDFRKYCYLFELPFACLEREMIITTSEGYHENQMRYVEW